MSAALRNKPARFMASLFSLPAGIKRAASRASVALASQSSSASGEGWLVWFNGPCPFENHVDSRHAIIRRLRVSARHPTFVFETRRVLHQRNTLISGNVLPFELNTGRGLKGGARERADRFPRYTLARKPPVRAWHIAKIGRGRLHDPASRVCCAKE